MKKIRAMSKVQCSQVLQLTTTSVGELGNMHAILLHFLLFCDEKTSLLRCLKLNENDNFDNKNWLLVIDNVM